MTTLGNKSAIEESQDESQTEWVLDALIGFLKSPLWNEPLFGFMDEKSIVFDPEDLESNQQEYLLVFKEYKNLVDRLLENHMRELSITQDQFAIACQEAEGVLSAKFHHALFEQLWAANDFNSFKRMMIQINIDLQLWALEVLAVRYGMVPDAFVPEGTTIDEFLGEDDFFLREAKRRSMLDAMTTATVPPKDQESGGGQQHSRRRSSTKTVIEVQATVNRSPSADQEQQYTRDTTPEQQIQITEKGTLDDSEKRKSTNEQRAVKETKQHELPPLASKLKGIQLKDNELVMAGDNESHQKIDMTRIDLPKESSQVSKVKLRSHSPIKTLNTLTEDMDPAEIKHRQDYLRRQRDKLLNLKKQEREKQLARMEDLQKSGRRPQTAKFMKLEAEAAAAENQTSGESGGVEGNTSLAYMRSLAARIKAEVGDGE